MKVDLALAAPSWHMLLHCVAKQVRSLVLIFVGGVESHCSTLFWGMLLSCAVSQVHFLRVAFSLPVRIGGRLTGLLMTICHTTSPPSVLFTG